MTIRINWLPTLCTSSLLLLAACGGGGPSTTAEPGAASGRRRARDGGHRRGGMGEPHCASGKTSFDIACGSCHPGGEADLGPALKGNPHSVANMTTQIREGSGPHEAHRRDPAARRPDEGPDGLPVDFGRRERRKGALSPAP